MGRKGTPSRSRDVNAVYEWSLWLVRIHIRLSIVFREFKQITTAGATTAAVTEKVWGEHVSVVCEILATRKQRCRKHELRSLKSLLFSFSQSNDFAQTTIALIRLVRTSRQFLMDDISNFRDKYLKEYRVKNTNVSILKKVK